MPGIGMMKQCRVLSGRCARRRTRRRRRTGLVRLMEFASGRPDSRALNAGFLIGQDSVNVDPRVPAPIDLSAST